jgi:hypothetical protein
LSFIFEDWVYGCSGKYQDILKGKEETAAAYRRRNLKGFCAQAGPERSGRKNFKERTQTWI